MRKGWFALMAGLSVLSAWLSISTTSLAESYCHGIYDYYLSTNKNFNYLTKKINDNFDQLATRKLVLECIREHETDQEKKNALTNLIDSF